MFERFLPRPTLQTAYRRRYWMLVTNIIENVCFSALLFGWASYLLVLKAEGFFEDVCNNGHHNDSSNHTGHYTNMSMHHQHDTGRHLLSAGPLPDAGGRGCPEQDTVMNIIYTVCLFFMSGSTFFIGALQDKFGYRKVRLYGSALFTVSNLLMMVANASIAYIIAPALLLNGLGGITVAFTSMQTPNLFGAKRQMMLGFMVGSFNSAAIVFPIFKSLYDVGISMKYCWTFLLCGGVWVFINTLFNYPDEIIPVPDELSERLFVENLNISSKPASKKQKGKTLFETLKQVGGRLSSDEVFKAQNFYTSSVDLAKQEGSSGGSNDDMTFKQVVFHPIYIWAFVFISITMLRILLYIGCMYFELMKQTGGDLALVSQYNKYFGYMQILCFPGCPLFGMVMDYKTKVPEEDLAKCKEDPDFAEKTQFGVRMQKLRNSITVFCLNIAILIVFGIAVLIPHLQTQFVTFVSHTIIRGTGVSACVGMFAVIFPFRHLGKLIGLNTLIGALVDLLQMPLFLIITGPSKGDPFVVNMCLLAFSLVAFGLPIYLYVYMQRLIKQQALRIGEKKSHLQKALLANGIVHHEGLKKEAYV